ncbi:MAG: DUF1684 domain-containing protein [Candidatus Delongbacteria bacterium]|nr:DUF1684 domain-containing protein [Candidatus Delongbacteria bacterium]
MFNEYNNKLQNDRIAKNTYLKNEINSPIPEEERGGFKGLNYFPVDGKFRFELELIEFPDKIEIIIKDSKGNDRHFIKFGKFKFKIDDIENQLIAYKSDVNDTRLFIPYKDKTTAIDSYGAGRYLDLEEEHDKVGEKWILDFNLAYNPWCAYNSKYSCPLVPDENVLNVAVTAGEKKYK